MSLKDNIDYIQRAVEDAASKAGRNPGDIKIMAVSKTRSIEEIEAVYDAGFRLFGENRVQEAVSKFTGFRSDAELHIIGPLQSNKVKKAVGIADCIQSVDRMKIADLINRYASESGRKMRIMIEYNTSGEDSKSGFRSEDEYFAALDEILKFESTEVTGLMTIGPLGGGETAVRKAFVMLRELFEKTNSRYPELNMRELSMGMSSDFPAAIEEGATLVRIGTLLFGPRVYR